MSAGVHNEMHPGMNAIRRSTYTVDDKKITTKEAIKIVGEEAFLSGICRSAFHYTSCREDANGTVVYFNSRILFR